LNREQKSYPDFLGIGAQKAGSTWLHENIRSHPMIWLPPKKEIHYFDHQFESNKTFSPQVNFSRKVSTPRWRRQFLRPVTKDFYDITIANLLWGFRYFFKERNDAWYASLFQAGTGKIKGDITPAYSTIGTDVIEYIHTIMPHVKIIFIMRNPIERAWSHAKMDLATIPKRPIESISENEFKRHFTSKQSKIRGSYSIILNNWQTIFSGSQMFICFFEEIMTKPDELLLRIFDFLGVDAHEQYIPGTLRKMVNKGLQKDIPDSLHKFLAELYLAELERLAPQCKGPVETWLESARDILKG
jgi:hypothetical protein